MTDSVEIYKYAQTGTNSGMSKGVVTMSQAFRPKPPDTRLWATGLLSAQSYIPKLTGCEFRDERLGLCHKQPPAPAQSRKCHFPNSWFF